jgi:hypothetical protein
VLMRNRTLGTLDEEAVLAELEALA